MKLLGKILGLFITNAARATEVEIFTYTMLHSTKQMSEARVTG